MTHPYPPHRNDLPFTGKYFYFLTFSTEGRQRLFLEERDVTLVRTQILRAAGEEHFEVIAYCFMPDHLHVVVGGRDESCDARRFIKRAKQYSGYYYKQANGRRLWQRYGFERVVRDDAELLFTIGYVVRNPVRAGLVAHPATYPFLGSERYTLTELMEMCDATETR